MTDGRALSYVVCGDPRVERWRSGAPDKEALDKGGHFEPWVPSLAI